MVAKKRVHLLYEKTPTPAAETKEGRKRLKAYRLALGSFIDAFAKAEIAMHYVLRYYTKTEDIIARAVFSGVRTDVAADHLRRLAAAKLIDPDEWKELEPILAQLKLIGGRRNIILHYGASDIAEGRGIATDAIMAVTQGKAKSFPVSPDILDDMTHDARKIFLHLVIRHAGRRTPRGRHPDLIEVLEAPWRYKSLPPNQSRPGPPGQPPAPPPPPESSPA